MFGETFGLDYHQQRHGELVQAAERERLVRCLAASRRAEGRGQQPMGLPRRALVAAGGQLVRLGTRLQGA